LTARELELGATQGLDDGGLVLVRGTNADDGLADVNTSNSTQRLSESTTHSSLEPVKKKECFV